MKWKFLKVKIFENWTESRLNSFDFSVLSSRNLFEKMFCGSLFFDKLWIKTTFPEPFIIASDPSNVRNKPLLKSKPSPLQPCQIFVFLLSRSSTQTTKRREICHRSITVKLEIYSPKESAGHEVSINTFLRKLFFQSFNVSSSPPAPTDGVNDEIFYTFYFYNEECRLLYDYVYIISFYLFF